MPANKGWASYPSQWVFTGSAEKTHCFFLDVHRQNFTDSVFGFAHLFGVPYGIPRLTQKDIFHFLERIGCVFSDFADGVWFCLCIVVLSQYCALPQFFIQTNILNSDLQDADHSSLISILFSATQHQKISKHRELLFISHYMTNQTLITISAKIRSTNHLFCSYYIFCMPSQSFLLALRRNSSYMQVLETKYMDINSVGTVPPCLPGG